jgi:hypothetical protein
MHSSHCLLGNQLAYLKIAFGRTRACVVQLSMGNVPPTASQLSMLGSNLIELSYLGLDKTQLRGRETALT